MGHDTAAIAAPTGTAPGVQRRLIACAAAALALSGCATPAWYLQSVTGHLRLLHAQRDLQQVLQDESIAPAVRERLGEVPALLEFAHSELGLPDNGSYRAFVQLDQPYVAWNVFAAPPLSLSARHWCYPVAGCISYRGYFAEAAAHAEGARRRAAGDDVYVGGVAAYSTLGWFRDPITSAMLRGDRLDLAAVLFHELAHQKLWIPGDTELNEAFAETVARVGVGRLAERDGTVTSAHWRARTATADRFHALVLEHRRALALIYNSDRPADEKLEAKARQLALLQAEYRRRPGKAAASDGFDRWLAEDLNNAKLVALSSYRELVPGLLVVFDQSSRDLETFYGRLRQLASCDVAARRVWVQSGGADGACAPSPDDDGIHQ